MAANLKSPRPLLGMTELWRLTSEYILFQAATLPGFLQKMAPQGNGAPLLFLPGFMAHDVTLSAASRFFSKLGYKTYDWGLGINKGSLADLEKLVTRLDDIYQENGRKVILVGHSLGGIYARELARLFPDKVNQVITLGTPFANGHDPAATAPAVRLLFDLLHGKNHPYLTQDYAKRSFGHPPVPTTSIYTKGDGVVHWRTCVGDAGKQVEHVRVYGSHCGLAVNPSALMVIADRAAQDPDQWKPFDAQDYPCLIYPDNMARPETSNKTILATSACVA